ncbi:MAG: hypothetical protein JWO73_246 [Candidatus Taylorbacteria bacterium]|nr:hypothetical protein [Candidatus Taylorbacteria bacterium]
MIESNKKAAVRFLELVIASKIDEAYAKHVDMGGKHHNAYFPAGFEKLRDAMKENESQFPNKRLAVKNVIAEGDLVVAHSHLRMRSDDPKDPGMTVVHIFRFKDGKIVEMWDCGQAIPADCPNEDGVF